MRCGARRWEGTSPYDLNDCGFSVDTFRTCIVVILLVEGARRRGRSSSSIALTSPILYFLVYMCSSMFCSVLMPINFCRCSQCIHAAFIHILLF